MLVTRVYCCDWGCTDLSPVPFFIAFVAVFIGAFLAAFVEATGGWRTLPLPIALPRIRVPHPSRSEGWEGSRIFIVWTPSHRCEDIRASGGRAAQLSSAIQSLRCQATPLRSA